MFYWKDKSDLYLIIFKFFKKIRLNYKYYKNIFNTKIMIESTLDSPSLHKPVVVRPK